VSHTQAQFGLNPDCFAAYEYYRSSSSSYFQLLMDCPVEKWFSSKMIEEKTGIVVRLLIMLMLPEESGQE
jgi:hypothetical protein